jgi:hypothetical protein
MFSQSEDEGETGSEDARVEGGHEGRQEDRRWNEVAWKT